MTLILVGSVDSAVILAADRRVQVVYPDGRKTPSEEDKLFLVGGCGVAAFGENPPGTHIPTFIRKLDARAWHPEELIATIRDQLALSGVPLHLGMLVVGEVGNELETWELLPAPEFRRLNLQSGTLDSRGTTVHGLPQLISLAEAPSQLVSIMRELSAACADVGPPYDLCVFRRGTQAQAERYDA